jgi:hypothetical protein
VVVALLAAAGCSFVDSSVSISKSISSPFESSSASSPGTQAYQTDVADYTYGHIISGGQGDALWKGIAGIAERHGVTNWEADMDTYVGIGQGAGRAKLKPTEFEAFATNLSGGDAKKMQAMQQGYDAAQKK